MAFQEGGLVGTVGLGSVGKGIEDGVGGRTEGRTVRAEEATKWIRRDHPAFR